MFHGTRRSSEDIARDRQGGLDFRFAADDILSRSFDKFYGHGLYLANALHYSHHFARPVSGNGAEGRTAVFICEVFVGECKDFGSEHRKDLRRPPEGFDSVCGRIQDDSNMFVVYDTSQVRPLYEITYKFKAYTSMFHVVPRFLRLTGSSYVDIKPRFFDWHVCDLIASSKTLWHEDVRQKWAHLLEVAAGSYCCIMVGDGAVGKSSLLQKLVTMRFDPGLMATIGVEFESHSVLIGSTRVKLEIWDLSGYNGFQTICDTYYTCVLGAVLVYDITLRESFDNLTHWLGKLRQNSARCQVIVIVGN